MSHVLLKVWKTGKFFNVMRHGQVSWGDIKNYKFFQSYEKQTGFSNLWRDWTSIFEEVRKTQDFSKTWKNHKFFQGYEKQAGFSNLWKIRSVFEKVMKITSLVSKAWKKSQVLDEPTLLQIWSVKNRFTND